MRLEGINPEVGRGEIVADITRPTVSEMKTKGKIIPIFGLGVGFNRDQTGRENLKYFSIMQNFDKAK